MKKKSSFNNELRLHILTRHQAPALGAPLSILSTGKMDVRQGVNLKLSGVERLTDKFIEKKRILEVSRTENNMMYCDYIWDLLSLLAGAIIVYRIAKKGRQLIKPLSFLSLCIGCLMVILPVIAMLIGKYHGICAILFGIVFFIFTYRDKNKPSPGLTIDYSWHLGGYEAGIIAIAYGLIRFCE